MLRWVLGEFLNIAHSSSPGDGKWTSVCIHLEHWKNLRLFLWLYHSVGFQRFPTMYTYTIWKELVCIHIVKSVLKKQHIERMNWNRAWFREYVATQLFWWCIGKKSNKQVIYWVHWRVWHLRRWTRKNTCRWSLWYYCETETAIILSSQYFEIWAPWNILDEFRMNFGSMQWFWEIPILNFQFSAILVNFRTLKYSTQIFLV